MGGQLWLRVKMAVLQSGWNITRKDTQFIVIAFGYQIQCVQLILDVFVLDGWD